MFKYRYRYRTKLPPKSCKGLKRKDQSSWCAAISQEYIGIFNLFLVVTSDQLNYM